MIAPAQRRDFIAVDLSLRAQTHVLLIVATAGAPRPDAFTVSRQDLGRKYRGLGRSGVLVQAPCDLVRLAGSCHSWRSASACRARRRWEGMGMHGHAPLQVPLSRNLRHLAGRHPEPPCQGTSCRKVSRSGKPARVYALPPARHTTCRPRPPTTHDLTRRPSRQPHPNPQDPPERNLPACPKSRQGPTSQRCPA